MITAAFVTAVLIAALLYVPLVYLPRKLLHPERHGPEFWRGREPFLTPADAGLAFEEIDFRMADGVRLAAWFIPAAPGPARGTIIYLHGVGGSRVTTIVGAAMFCHAGYNVFTYDSRASGISGGRFCTYGYFEKHDVSAAIDLLEKRGDVPAGTIGVLGKSMGGAVALQAAAMDPRIRCVIAEAAFTDLKTVSREAQRRVTGTDLAVLHRMALWAAERTAKFDAKTVSPLNAVRTCRTPVLFIHGADDDIVFARHTHALYDAAIGPKELWIIRGGGHGSLYKTAGEEYRVRRLAFFEHYLV